MHLSHNVGEQSNHIIISHGHIRYNLFQCNFLGRVVLVLLAATKKLLTQLSYFTLPKWVSSWISETDKKAAANSCFSTERLRSLPLDFQYIRYLAIGLSPEIKQRRLTLAKSFASPPLAAMLRKVFVNDYMG